MTNNTKYKISQALVWCGSVSISVAYYLASDFRVKAALVGAGIAADIAGLKLTYDVVTSDYKKNNAQVVDDSDYNEDDIIDVEYVIVESA